VSGAAPTRRDNSKPWPVGKTNKYQIITEDRLGALPVRLKIAVPLVYIRRTL
jgi:hypothetical protein